MEFWRLGSGARDTLAVPPIQSRWLGSLVCGLEPWFGADLVGPRGQNRKAVLALHYLLTVNAAVAALVFFRFHQWDKGHRGYYFFFKSCPLFGEA